MKKIIIIVMVLIIGVGAWMFTKGKSPIAGIAELAGQQTQVSKLDASDTVESFYSQWLIVAQHPTAIPTKETLTNSPLLSSALKTKIKNAGTGLDPVLCQTVVPAGISMRKVFVNDNSAQILVTSKDKKVTQEALVILVKNSNGWSMDDIQCSAGEFAPVKEFTFEATGFLLKDSIPAPYDPKVWHIVYTEAGKDGNVVPLIFDSKSQCVALDGTKSLCKPTNLTETTKVSVHGQMTEAGASVTRMEFVK